MISMSYKELAAELPSVLKAGVVPYIRGSPAIGKSSLAQEIANKFGLLLIDVRLAECDPTEIGGFPYFDEVLGKAKYYPLTTFPTTEDKVPEGYKGWLLMLDEFSSASIATQGASYKLVLDRKVGQHKLHPNVFIIAAGNKEDDGAIVNPMSTALISRFAIFQLELNFRDWMEWAVSSGIDYRITSFLNFASKHLYQFKADATDPYSSPRTWHMLSKIIKPKETSDINVAVVASLIGEGVAREFMTFLALEAKLPKFEVIVAKPEETVLPNELGVQWAIMGMIAHNISASTAGQVSKYLDRFSDELKVVTIREIRMRHPKLLDESKDFKSWFTKTAMATFS